jgi:hypothetical protein
VEPEPKRNTAPAPKVMFSMDSFQKNSTKMNNFVIFSMCIRVSQKTKLDGCAGFPHSLMPIEYEYHNKNAPRLQFQQHVKIEKCDFEKTLV